MKKITVHVKDRNTIVLEEDALKGDYIDLTSLSNVDYSKIEQLIEEGKDKVYENKLSELKKILQSEAQNNILKLQSDYQKQIAELNNQIKEILEANKSSLIKQALELENKHKDELNELNNKIKELNELNRSSLTKQALELENKYKDELNSLNNKINTFEINKKAEIDALKSESTNALNSLAAKHESALLLQKSELEKNSNEVISNLNKTISNFELSKKIELDTLKNQTEIALLNKDKEFEQKLSKIKEEHQAELNLKDAVIKEKEEQFTSLQRQRASLNVKQTGEDLESWCDHEVQSHMQNGLFNCIWEKDNKVIKEDGEVKGSKADYIYRIYASNEHKKDEILASVCLDMKDENPDSINKKKNSDYYAALDRNRIKKECKYAVLVSNLETDKTGDLPIFRVLEYPDMYVVRPAYMMTFLNMITSLTTRFADLVLADEDRKLEIKKSIEFKEEFDKLKNTYLDKPLEKLTKDLAEIKKNNDNILSAAKKIEDAYDSITRNYINVINDKINNFDVKIFKDYKKFEKE